MKVIDFLEATLRKLGNWLRTLNYATYKIKTAKDANGEEFYLALVKTGKVSPYKIASTVYKLSSGRRIVLQWSFSLAKAYRFKSFSEAYRCAESVCNSHNEKLNKQIVEYSHFFEPLD